MRKAFAAFAVLAVLAAGAAVYVATAPTFACSDIKMLSSETFAINCSP